MILGIYNQITQNWIKIDFEKPKSILTCANAFPNTRFINVILVRIEFIVTRFMFGNSCIKSDFDIINVVWIILFKIIFRCIIIKRVQIL